MKLRIDNLLQGQDQTNQTQDELKSTMDKVLERLESLAGVSTGRGNSTIHPSGIVTLYGPSMKKNKGTNSSVVVSSGPKGSGTSVGDESKSLDRLDLSQVC